MIDLKEIHDRINLHFRKEFAGYFAPPDIDRALDEAQLLEVSLLYGDERRIGSLIGNNATLKIDTALAPLRKRFDFNKQEYAPDSTAAGTGPKGVIVLPADFLFLSPGIVISGAIRTRMISEDSLVETLSSTLRQPSALFPVALFAAPSEIAGRTVKGPRLQVFPEVPVEGFLYYYQRPPKPNLAGTVSGRTFVYDAKASEQIVFDDVTTTRIIQRAISILGEPSREFDLMRTNEEKNNR